MKPALVLIGPGRVGCAIGRLLHQAGYPLAAVIGRDQQKAEDAARFIGCDIQVATTDLQAAAKGDILLLTLPDDQLAGFSARLSDEVVLANEVTLIHCSGLLPAEILRRQRSDIGLLSIHPLLPFADRQRAVKNLLNCPCALEGDSNRHELGQALIAAWGGTAFLLPTDAKPRYHAAASIASNFMVSLSACARDLLVDCGLEPHQAMQLLAPLQHATHTNIIEQGPEQALTGPIVRGDSNTVATHLKVLENQSGEVADLYRSLGKITAQLAEKSGRLPSAQAETIKALFEK